MAKKVAILTVEFIDEDTNIHYRRDGEYWRQRDSQIDTRGIWTWDDIPYSSVPLNVIQASSMIPDSFG